jgi:tetratricopeptide (TPR) repeat protein
MRAVGLRKIFLLAGLGFGAHNVASAIENITAGELALTPAFCQDVQTMNGWSKTRPSPRTAHWIGLMGDSFWAMHHFCWAMVGLYRAQMPGLSPMTRSWLIKNAIDDYRFVVNNSTPDFVLLPEVYTRMGDAQLLLGDVGSAFESFARARALKPDYWPPYLRWADLLVKSNKKTEARDVIAEGLRYSPNAQPLLDKYVALGGNLQNVRHAAAAPAAASGVSGKTDDASVTAPP